MGCGCGKCGGGAAWVAIVAAIAAATGTMLTSKDKDEATGGNNMVQAPHVDPVAHMEDTKVNDRSVLGYTMTSIDGASVDLAQYKGKVVLLVNVASKCGLTKQYAGLEKLYRGRKDAGLVVLGFPANNFGGQEPGTDKEIQTFCTTQYSVTFPMFSKISVKGDDAHPLFVQLAALSEEPTWNFTKYLVDRDGQFVQRFDPQTAPEDPALEAKVEELLSAPVPAK